MEPFPFPVQSCWSERAGEGYAASRPLRAGDLVLRVASAAAVPKTSCMLACCANCFSRGGELRPCAGCGAVAHCARCAALPPGRHAEECYALKRLALENRSIAGADTVAVRLLLRLLCFVAETKKKKAPRAREEDDDEEEGGAYGPLDVIVDRSLEDLMTGELPDELVALHAEVRQQQSGPRAYSPQQGSSLSSTVQFCSPQPLSTPTGRQAGALLGAGGGASGPGGGAAADGAGALQRIRGVSLLVKAKPARRRSST